MQDLTGPVVLALVALWLVFLIPQVLRQREASLESRVEDRNSDRLRVVAVLGQREPVRQEPAGWRNTTGLLTPRGRWWGGSLVDSSAAWDAARHVTRLRGEWNTARARRAAASRRRGALAGGLLVTVAVTWFANAVIPSLSVVVAVIPSALLALVLAAGRAAVIAGRHHDAQWEALINQAHNRGAGTDETTDTAAGEPPTRRASSASAPARPVRRRRPRTVVGPRRPRANAPTTAISTSTISGSTASRPTATRRAATGAHNVTTGRAVHPSAAPTDIFDVIVADRGEEGPGARHASGATPVVDDSSWSPIAVPPPAYALKPVVERPTPRPVSEQFPLATQTSGSIDLDAVLARRRASGQ